MSEQTTMGVRCALCGTHYIGEHACVAPRSMELLESKWREYVLLLQILDELKAVRTALEKTS